MMLKSVCQLFLILKLSIKVVLPSAQHSGPRQATLVSELVVDASRRKLLVPTSTRWNSFYEAVSRITEIPISDLNDLCVRLGIKGFTVKGEYQFLGEYCVVMKLLTVALDILQREDHRFYGTLLPTLEVLIAPKVSLSKMTAGLRDNIVQVGRTMRSNKANIFCGQFRVHVYI